MNNIRYNSCFVDKDNNECKRSISSSYYRYLHTARTHNTVRQSVSRVQTHVAWHIIIYILNIKGTNRV